MHTTSTGLLYPILVQDTNIDHLWLTFSTRSHVTFPNSLPLLPLRTFVAHRNFYLVEMSYIGKLYRIN